MLRPIFHPGRFAADMLIGAKVARDQVPVRETARVAQGQWQVEHRPTNWPPRRSRHRSDAAAEFLCLVPKVIANAPRRRIDGVVVVHGARRHGVPLTGGVADIMIEYGNT